MSPWRCTLLIGVGSLALIGGFSAPRVAADEVRLQSGGRIRGQWLNAKSDSAKKLVFRTASGVQVVVARERIQEAAVVTPELRQYERLAPRFADTVAAQWRLAEWCRQRKLDPQRERHLQRIIELQPNHPQARRGLGYAQLDGRWVRQKDYMQERGYRSYQGRWLTQQEIDLVKQRKRTRLAERQWYGRMKRWREELLSEKTLVAQRRFHSIRDPHAVYGLRKLWSREAFRLPKMMYVTALKQIPSGAALTALVHISLHDPDEEVYHAALEGAVREPIPEVIDVYVKALRSRNPRQVNRAGAALARFNNRSTISPLIDALITRQPIVIRRQGRGGITTSFGKSEGPDGAASPFGGFAENTLTTGDQTRVFWRTTPNHEVLDALVRMSGQSFGFNQRAWRAWLDTERSQVTQTVDTRRQQ